jgi:hypothetical protein
VPVGEDAAGLLAAFAAGAIGVVAVGALGAVQAVMTTATTSKAPAIRASPARDWGFLIKILLTKSEAAQTKGTMRRRQ